MPNPAPSISLVDNPQQPNCVITVYYDKHLRRFNYSCTSRDFGWVVHPDGGIYPPSLSRVVEFRAKGWPDSTSFAGFQFAPVGEDLPAKKVHWPPLPPSAQGGPGIRCVKAAEASTHAPVPYPPPNKVRLWRVTFDFGPYRWRYRLAMVGEGGSAVWDDPKIHDDGSE